MTKDEIIDKLQKLGIIAVIGDEHIITEKYKDCLLYTSDAADE